MLATVRFKRALKIVEKWPLDPTKAEYRDIGAFLRKKIETDFRQGEHTELGNPEMCDKMLKSLENIVNNKYKMRYPSGRTKGALGLSYEETRSIISEEGLAAIREEAEMGMIRRTIHRISDGRLGGKKDEQQKLE